MRLDELAGEGNRVRRLEMEAALQAGKNVRRDIGPFILRVGLAIDLNWICGVYLKLSAAGLSQGER